MRSCELVTLIDTLAFAITECSSEDDILLLITILAQLATTLRTISVNKRICESKMVENKKENIPNEEIDVFFDFGNI